MGRVKWSPMSSSPNSDRNASCPAATRSPRIAEDVPNAPVEGEILEGVLENEGPQGSVSTVVAPLPFDAPSIERDTAATMAGTEIASLPPGVAARLEIDGVHRQRFEVTKTVTVIGRAEPADFILPNDQEASRLHAALLYSPGGFFLEDLQSSNGTYLDGQRVERVRLYSGDKIRIGTTQIVVVIEI